MWCRNTIQVYNEAVEHLKKCKNNYKEIKMANILEEESGEFIPVNRHYASRGRPVGSTRAKKPIFESEFNKIIEFIRDTPLIRQDKKSRWIKCIIISYYTGVRASELLQLNVASIREAVANQESSLNNKTKTRKTRLLMFSTKSVDVIRKNFKDELSQNGGYHPKDFIFHAPRDRKKTLNPVSFIRQFNQIIHAALSSDLYSSHSFRKGLITSLAKTASPRVAQAIIGHSNVKTTLEYYTPTLEDARLELEKVR